MIIQPSMNLLMAVSVMMACSIDAVERTNIFKLKHHGPPPPPPGSEVTHRASEEHFITQRLDHFDILDTRTWQQRYFTSADTYQTGGPIFLYLSGEWEASPGQVTDRFIGKMAETYGAFMINLEHRFYGESRPTVDTSVANLRYLSADQALEDAAVFTQYMVNNSKYNLTGPWFVFGGSYSANLAAWARARYPHLYFAAHASSGPVLAQLDFPEYHEVVNEALAATSPECPGYVTAAMNELYALVDQGNSAAIKELYNLCDDIDLSNAEDLQYIYMASAEFFSGEVQSARPGTLKELCDTLEAGQNAPLDTLAQLLRANYGPSCLTSHYQDVLDMFNTTIAFTSDISRQWYYQTCTEFGYWQTLSSLDQPFGQVVPVEFYLSWCSGVYGPEFTRAINEAGIARTNLMNGGLTPDVTRVLYTHGSLDPWHRLGLETDLNADSPVIIIDGASHCNDLSADSALDTQALKNARVQISQIIGQWLQQWQKERTH